MLNLLLIVDKISKPFSNPGPRKELIEDRLALSNDALKTSGILYLLQAHGF